MRLKHNIATKATIVLFSIYFFLFGWFSRSQFETVVDFFKPKDSLERIKKDGTINVVLPNSSTTYYIGNDSEGGFEYELLKEYAKHLGVKLNVIVVPSSKAALELNGDSNIDIISANLASNETNKQLYNLGPSYLEVQEQVVCNRTLLQSKKFPKDIDNLKGLNIAIEDDSRYALTINSLKMANSDLNATYSSDYTTEELLAKVASNEFDCTVVDSNVFAINQRYYPEITYAFSVGQREQLAWIITKESKKLTQDIYEWLNAYTQSGEMSRLKDHYFSNVVMFDYQDITMFYNRVKTRLPKYKDLFDKAAKKYNIPYHLLAALSYQESHWDPNAISPTGVKGLMMLTLDTASSLKVTNREDPKESIYGGALHLRNIIESLDDAIVGEDRYKIALASYNIGLGHISDAQYLAQKSGLNPYVWKDIRSVLPLLVQRKYYTTLKFGYARGSEAVKYVESVYNYKDMLQNATLLGGSNSLNF